MELNTRDKVMKKLLDAQENVRDFESFSKQVDDNEISETFKKFAEECGMQSTKLQSLLNKFDSNNV
jgi:hypothetical protein